MATYSTTTSNPNNSQMGEENNVPENKWHLNNEFPDKEGYYLVTVLEGLMTGSSYAWVPSVSYFTGEEWVSGGVLAWIEIPFDTFHPANTEERRIVFANQGSKKSQEANLEKSSAEYTVTLTDELPF